MKKFNLVIIIGFSICTMLLLFRSANLLSAQSNYVEQKVIASDGSSNDSFGWSVCTSGNISVVGARMDDPLGSNSGSAYIFRWNGTDWVEEQKLTPSDGVASDYFGASVSCTNDVVIIGSTHDDDNGTDSGAAYIFRWDGTNWIEEQKLIGSDSQTGDQLGISVAIDNDVIVAGAFKNDTNGSNSGSAYVFRWNGTDWVEEKKLLPSDGASSDQFGQSVSISDSKIVVGNPNNDDYGSNSGSAYIFNWDGTDWVEEQKLIPSDGASGEYFGRSVSISDDAVLISSYYDDVLGSASGSAYMFRFNGTTWVEEQKLTASDGAASDQFGYSVSLEGNTALISAYADDDGGSNSGSAYIYVWDGTSWTEDEKLTASDPRGGDYYGVSVSASDSYLLIGSRADDDNGANSGSAYFYSITNPPTPTATPPTLPTNLFEHSKQYMSYRNSYDVALGDLDGDGDLDAIVGNYGDGSANRVWENLGNGLFIDTGQNLFNNANDVLLGDIDNDGDLDAVFSVFNGGGKVWLNNGDATFVGGANLSLGDSISLGDINNDGNLDIVTSGSGTTILYGNGTGQFPNSSNQLSSGGPDHSLGDFDNDNDLDLVIARSGTAQIWRNENGEFTTLVQEFSLNNSSVEIADLDGDNDLDVFLLSQPYGGSVWINDGSGLFTKTSQHLGNMGGTLELILGDFDLDNDVDAVAYSGDGSVWINDGSGMFANSGEEFSAPNLASGPGNYGYW